MILTASNAQLHDPQDPVYFLLHLPKTAGQTIAGHLAAHCRPGAYLEPRRGTRSLDPRAVQTVRALSGHWLRRSMEAAFPRREIRRSALLRDPVGLQLSLYNYRMMNYDAKGLGTYSFPLHLASVPRNYLAFCLLTRWLGFSRVQATSMSEDRQFTILDTMLRDFWFVGAYSECDRLIAQVADDLAVPPIARRQNDAVQWREITTWTPLREDGVDQQLAERIRREHSVDQALWEHWALSSPTAEPEPRTAQVRWLGAAGTLLQDLHRRWLRDIAGAIRLGQSSRVGQADAARAAHDWPAAAAGYRAAIGLTPGTPSLWIECARALRNHGDAEAARAAFDRALALKPNMPSIQIERAALPGFQTPLPRAAAAGNP